MSSRDSAIECNASAPENLSAVSSSRSKRITIDPITRLEGHGKIDIFLDADGEVERAYFQIPELRGFEKFVQGRPVEEMPQITSRICGVCPTAHHMAAAKALDDLYKVDPPPAAKAIRELIYSAFIIEDHALHFYFLGGPDFILGPDAAPASRNVLGVIAKVGIEVGKRVISMRRRLREVMALVAGKAAHPVFGLPGGVAKRVNAEMQKQSQEVAAEAFDFAQFTLELFQDVVLKNSDYVEMILSDAYTHATYYMGMVDHQNQVNFYDGAIRVVTPSGDEWKKFLAPQYLENVAEHVEPWSYVKFCYLKPIGWKGFTEGAESGIYCVAPLARLNASDGMATPLAQHAYHKMFSTLGGKPVHHTLANHWARLIELLYAAERMKQIAADPILTDDHIRNMPTETPTEGIGAIEAPRGTLIHHYQTDKNGMVKKANLIVATQNNAARIAMSVEKAAKELIHHGDVPEGVLNRIEMAFRAYDPCNGCATHSLPGSMPLMLRVHDRSGTVLTTMQRDYLGGVHRE
ncbi:MAG TPA: Ni/Fe hydrogenase subunit alpha [Dongiaceae bacterium]|nr:Ni/Fe hydrogenase subunit alpha [Dongiaceae bacterium]